MFKALKIIGLYIVKSLGVFWFMRRLNKGNTCVLCYHGFSYKDEYKFRPKLFMRPSTFIQRIRWLNQSNYHIISLQDAVKNKDLYHNSVVLTMDDGWASTFELVYSFLKEIYL